MGKREDYTTGTGQRLKVHAADECAGDPCPIHNPSDHSMRDFPTHWRDDRGLMERICPHGVGHPDPDDFSVRNDINGAGIHGCDGCCTGEHPLPAPQRHKHPLPAPTFGKRPRQTNDERYMKYGDGSVYDTQEGKWVKLVGDVEIAEQLRFVEWLKEKGLYNQWETPVTMQKLMKVWEACNE